MRSVLFKLFVVPTFSVVCLGILDGPPAVYNVGQKTLACTHTFQDGKGSAK